VVKGGSRPKQTGRSNRSGSSVGKASRRRGRPNKSKRSKQNVAASDLGRADRNDALAASVCTYHADGLKELFSGGAASRYRVTKHTHTNNIGGTVAHLDPAVLGDFGIAEIIKSALPPSEQFQEFFQPKDKAQLCKGLTVTFCTTKRDAAPHIDAPKKQSLPSSRQRTFYFLAEGADVKFTIWWDDDAPFKTYTLNAGDGLIFPSCSLHSVKGLPEGSRRAFFAATFYVKKVKTTARTRRSRK
jgi:hypothetical protein